MQAAQKLHFASSMTAFLSIMVIALCEHALTHKEQPMHFSKSTLILMAPDNSLFDDLKI
jgi:hypothetical protein